MKIWFKILFTVFLFSTSISYAQVGLNVDQQIETTSKFSAFKNIISDYNLSIIKTGTAFESQSVSNQNPNFSSVPKIYSYHNLAFFCKVEVKLEKAAKFPVKFRLGDVNYVDQLEGK